MFENKILQIMISADRFIDPQLNSNYDSKIVIAFTSKHEITFYLLNSNCNASTLNNRRLSSSIFWTREQSAKIENRRIFDCESRNLLIFSNQFVYFNTWFIIYLHFLSCLVYRRRRLLFLLDKYERKWVHRNRLFGLLYVHCFFLSDMQMKFIIANLFSNWPLHFQISYSLRAEANIVITESLFSFFVCCWL